jgi:hypothetical protein
MLIAALVFIFFVLLAIAYELHIITDRVIEIGTLVEHYNRRDLRASGIKDSEDDDFASESITKTHRTWKQILLGVLLASIVTTVMIKLLGAAGLH